MPKIIRVDAKMPEFTKKKRVAAYARVSMESENLLHSAAAQKDYFQKYIKSMPEWEYCGIYADIGITGTSTLKRDEFNRMIADCDEGKLDLILVKSISRFGRNTVDTIDTIRHLKARGVEVRFERENISSFTGDGELLLTILASYAQEESRSISLNLKWSIRNSFERGIPNCHRAPYGYEWDGEIFKAIPEQADVVKRIFGMYLDGKTPFSIRDVLNNEGIQSKTGGDFTDGTIKQMLSNRSYTGVMILQKNFINEYHRRIVNRGELARYAVTGMYEPIITAEDFERAQAIRAERAVRHERSSLSGRVRCGCCGRSMSRRDAKGKPRWVCNGKERKSGCTLKDIYETELMADALSVTVFDDRVETILFNKKKLITKRSYEGRRRGGFSGRIFCGCPVHREEKSLRKCAGRRKGKCSLKLLPDEELLKATADVLKERNDPETAFARDVRRLTVYDDRLEFETKEGEVLTWKR